MKVQTEDAEETNGGGAMGGSLEGGGCIKSEKTERWCDSDNCNRSEVNQITLCIRNKSGSKLD